MCCIAVSSHAEPWTQSRMPNCWHSEALGRGWDAVAATRGCIVGMPLGDGWNQWIGLILELIVDFIVVNNQKYSGS